jgi:hypothetical protein
MGVHRTREAKRETRKLDGERPSGESSGDDRDLRWDVYVL